MRRHPNGTVDVIQSAGARTARAPHELEQIYWRALRDSTAGAARFSRNAVRVFGVWPVLLRFGPLRDGRRAILGGVFVRRAHGTISWSADGDTVTVTVEGFAPLLRGPLWQVEAWLHALVGRRYIARAGS